MARKQLQPVRIPTKKNNSPEPDEGQKSELILVSRKRGTFPGQNNQTQPETNALLVLILFLILNIGCFSLIDIAPDRLQLMLGSAPNSLYVNLAYALFVIAEIILLLSRLGSKPVGHHAWRKLGFICTFYVFFWFTGDLSGNFVLLLATGFGLLLSEYIRLLRLTIKNAEQAPSEY